MMLDVLTQPGEGGEIRIPPVDLCRDKPLCSGLRGSPRDSTAQPQCHMQGARSESACTVLAQFGSCLGSAQPARPAQLCRASHAALSSQAGTQAEHQAENTGGHHKNTQHSHAYGHKNQAKTVGLQQGYLYLWVLP